MSDLSSKIIVMFPTEMEARPFAERYAEAGVERSGGGCETVVCGVGLAECAARTAQTIVERRPSLLILAGIAGAYPDKGLQKGDTVFVAQENSYDLGSYSGGDFRPIAALGGDPAANFHLCDTPLSGIFPSVVSNSVNVAASHEGNTLLPAGVIENMEGAAFFAVCRALGVPFMEVRTVSNIVGESPALWNIPEAAARLAENMQLLLNHLQNMDR